MKEMAMSPTCFDSGAIVCALGAAANTGMYGPEPCINVLTGTAQQLWSFLIGNEGHYLFASLATYKALLYYLRRSPLTEAKHLADVLITALLLFVLAAALESPSAIRHAFQCHEFQPTAMNTGPQAGRRATASSGWRTAAAAYTK